jgi:protein phosphatase PTC2/3
MRNYNEDRVSIILNMTKPATKQTTKEWPKCSFFAIYDGHGGSLCADFLKDNLHQIIIQQDTFPSDPAQALTTGCLDAEYKFLKLADSLPKHDRSGSCAIIVLTVEHECFIANVGDSRAIMSADAGKKLFLLSRDHRPNEPSETSRIVANGGQVY